MTNEWCRDVWYNHEACNWGRHDDDFGVCLDHDLIFLLPDIEELLDI